MTNPAHTPVALEIDDLAQEIRRVDGSNELGAGALAEAIMPFLRAYLSAVEAGEMGDPHSPYMRIVTFFDQDDTAGSFLNEDGEGGFTGAVYRMAREIDTLRAEVARLKAQPGVVKAAQDAVAELANVPMQMSLEDWSRISNAILAALAAPVSQEPVAWRVKADAQLEETQRAWNERDGEKRIRALAEQEGRDPLNSHQPGEVK